MSGATQRWLMETPLAERKRLGQYMTPEILREKLLDRCELFAGMRVLDPGVGTGEFLKSVSARQPQAETHGWDVDPKVLEAASANAPLSRLAVRSALEEFDGEPFDLVIGNPPYFEFKASPEMRRRFAGVIAGRVNVFALFFQVGLEALRAGGQLAYVVPPSMNSGAYFEPLRRYLLERAEIEFLEVQRHQGLFTGAQTPVQLLVLRKFGESPPASVDDRGQGDRGERPRALRKSGGREPLGGRRHAFMRESAGFSRVLFLENPAEALSAFDGRRSLYELGYEAVTGTVVWNQHRKELRRASTNGEVPLIWSHNINDGLRLSPDHRRPQYIETDKSTLSGPAIVVNRVVGAVGSGELRCALVGEGMSFLAENHVNVIRRREDLEPLIDWGRLLQGLQAKETAGFARLVTGNTQISATELTHLLPIATP